MLCRGRSRGRPGTTRLCPLYVAGPQSASDGTGAVRWLSFRTTGAARRGLCLRLAERQGCSAPLQVVARARVVDLSAAREVDDRFIGRENRRDHLRKDVFEATEGAASHLSVGLNLRVRWIVGKG